MIHVLLAIAPAVPPVEQASTIFAILAAAVVVLGGLGALVRAIWGVSNMLRDNTVAVRSLTTRMDELAVSVDGRFDKLAERVAQLEWREQGTRHSGDDLSAPRD